MDKKVEISICIPAYKNTVYLKRLLDSISSQTFKNFEVIVTDDSPDDTVKTFLDNYHQIRNLQHYKNQPPVGTPENWNEGIRRANGKWIKLMHDDDWFASADTLKIFWQTTEANPDCSFFFAAFQNVTEDTGAIEVVRCNILDRIVLRLSPLHLFGRVYVGNPSCTFIKKEVGEYYDKRFKFVVDFEYYIRCFYKLKRYKYIDEVLMNIGFNSDQVTKYTFLVPEVQIPENLALLEKLGSRILQNPLVYDYYWRMFRNLKVRSIDEVESYYADPINPVIIQLLNFQGKFPAAVLKVGVVSKVLMILSYIKSRLV